MDAISMDGQRIAVKIKAVSPRIASSLPSYATPGSAGLDLRAAIPEPIVIDPGGQAMVPTGIAIQIPSPNIGAFVFARSGLASKHGIHLANGVGVIDSDYVGEIKCPIANAGKEPFRIEPGDRIAQLVFLPVYLADWILVTELDETERGQGGFGHTGR